MSSYPFLKMYTCTDDVIDVEHLDITYSIANLFNVPKINVSIDSDINVFITNVTKTSARINFSSKYTGTVRYSVISMT